MLATVADLDSGRVDTGRVVAAAQQAEAAGFDRVYVGDHLLHRHPILEPLVTLAALATATHHITLGTCVLLAALRQPVTLAKQLGSLAAFAPGRVRVGVGVGGEYPAEFAAASVAMAGRGAHLDASVAELRALLRGEGPGLAPVTDVPVFFGGWSDAALDRAVRLGDGWIGYLIDEGSFTRRRARLLEHAGAGFGTGMLLPVHVGDDDVEAARREGADRWQRLTGADATALERHLLAGPPEQVAAGVRRFLDAGSTEVVLAPADQGAGYLDQVDVLAREVLPLVHA